MPEIIAADTSVLISLEKINLLQILCKIYKEIVLPEAVINEFGNINLECHSIKKVEGSLVNLLVKELNLGKGESEAIALAYEEGLKILIDDLKARKIAEDLGLNITGTIGVLLKAEKLGLIESALEKAKELKKKGFYVSDDLLVDMYKFKPI